MSSFNDCVKRFNFADCVDDNDSVHSRMFYTGSLTMSLANRLSTAICCTCTSLVHRLRRPHGLRPWRQLRTGRLRNLLRQVAASAMDAANCTLIRGSIIQPIAVIRVTNAVTTTDNRVANADRSSAVSRACGDIAATPGCNDCGDLARAVVAAV